MDYLVTYCRMVVEETKISSFEEVYVYPPLIKEYFISYKVPVMKYYIATLDEFLHTLKSQLKHARNRIKQQTKKRRTDQEFMI